MVKLKPLTKGNVFPFYKWINDDEVIKYSLSRFQKISTKEEINKWFYALVENKEIISYGIFLKSNGELIGYAGICDISETNKSGEYYIFIGEKKLWGKGIGTEVSKEVLRIGFSEYQLNRIFLTVSEPNTGGKKAYEKAGFKYEGTLRQASFRDNKYHDLIMMSVLKSEWKTEFD